jgi:hypothetical protein
VSMFVCAAEATKGSAWNTAGTFESVTHTPWAIARLEALIDGEKSTCRMTHDRCIPCQANGCV